MDITSNLAGDTIEVHLKGRLDGYWADHLTQALEDTMRRGHHHIRLNMTEVVYLSSLGIRVLVDFYKQAEAIEGSLIVSGASPVVKKVLDMVGLTAKFMPVLSPAAAPAESETPSRVFDSESASFEIFDFEKAQPLSFETIGQAKLLAGCRFTERDCQKVAFPESSFAIGLGAFGQGFTDCSKRFGEFLAIAGAAAYQPTDGSNVPDFVVSKGSLIPELEVLYGALWKGAFSCLARFESKEDETIGLAELVGAALDISGAENVAIVCVAESAGLIGATLRKSPVNGTSDSAPFGHPEIRQWLSFTTERAYGRGLAVVAGIASRSDSGFQKDLLRPMAGVPNTFGHFHAAAFSYRPLQRGIIDLKETVRSVFESETLKGILHLIGDDRDAVGVSESELVRGACWIGIMRNSQ